MLIETAARDALIKLFDPRPRVSPATIDETVNFGFWKCLAQKQSANPKLPNNSFKKGMCKCK